MKQDKFMQLRTIALMFSFLGLLYSGMASALGLGEITLKSQYNQPLEAEIRLLQVRDLSEEEILVELASREDFQRAGVDRVYFLTGLVFEVVLSNPSNPHIRVSSRKPVTEPYLDFLVEVQWPSGRLLREYTLLLDLPVFAETSSTPSVAAPSSTVAAPTPVAPAAVSTPAPAPAEPVSRQPAAVSAAPVNTVDSYRVQRGDTLWDIAEKVRPNSSTTVNQTMIALQQANPGAFIGGNINNLRNGRVLRVPNAAEINSISYEDAIASVRQQNRDWNSQQKAVLTSAAPVSQPAQTGAPVEGRLKLGSADEGVSDVKGTGSSGSGESLQNELAIAQDELSRAQRENSELQSRVKELEEQIETMERLVSVTSDQLKALELATASEPESETVEESVSEAPTGDVSDASIEAASDADVVSEATEDGSAETTEESVNSVTEESEIAADAEIAAPSGEAVAEEPSEPVVEAPVEEAPAPAVVPTPAPVSASPGIMDIVKQNILAIGGGLVALLLAILVLLRLREKPESEDFDEFDESASEDMFAEEELDLGSDMDLDESVSDELDEAPVEAETEDPVAEADIYVSLGQEDKAIELLEKEIGENPDNADARLGLLRIFATMQNASAFDEQYAQLLPLGNNFANEQATALRKEIDGIEPFDTDNYSPSIEESAEAIAEDIEPLDLDLAEVSLDLDDLNDEDFDGLDTEGAKSDSSSLDLDDEDLSALSLDLEALAEDTVDTGLTANEESKEESLDDLDLDLDLDLDIEDDDEPSINFEAPSSEVSLDEDLTDELDELDVNSLEVEPTEDLSVESAENLSLESDLDLDLDLLEVEADDDKEAESVELDLDLDLESDLDLDAPEAESDLDFPAVETEISESEKALDLDEPLDTGSDDLTAAVTENLSADIENAEPLDFDAPLPEDLDMASLDEELDELTADLDSDADENLEGGLDKSTVDLGADLAFDSEVDLDGDLDSILEDGLSLENDLTLGEDLSTDIEQELSTTDLTEDLPSLDDVEDELNLAADDFNEADLNALAEAELDVELDDAPAAQDAVEESELTPVTVDDEVAVESEDDLDFLEASDEVATKLDLARAYLDMGDREGAEDILNEVLEEGNEEQKADAQQLLQQI